MEEKHCDANIRNKIGNTRLHTACGFGHLDVVKYLINEQGVDPSCTNNNGSTPLHFAKSVEVAKFLVEEKHCDANRRNKHGNTLLHTACDFGHLDVVKYLINEQGVDPSCTNNNGSTPLHLAKSVEVAKFLVEEKHCDTNKTDDVGNTPLHDAAKWDQLSVFRYLIFSKHCDITLRNDDSMTPLHVACKKGLTDVVLHLINEPGVSLLEQDDKGYSAQDYAVGHPDIVKIKLAEYPSPAKRPRTSQPNYSIPRKCSTIIMHL